MLELASSVVVTGGVKRTMWGPELRQTDLDYGEGYLSFTLAAREVQWPPKVRDNSFG
jgi:hypothetical protein